MIGDQRSCPALTVRQLGKPVQMMAPRDDLPTDLAGAIVQLGVQRRRRPRPTNLDTSHRRLTKGQRTRSTQSSRVRRPSPRSLVPFGPCPTVAAGHGIQVAWLQHEREETDPAIFARASRLRAVSMDMGEGYAKAVRQHAPQAIICIDNYHVVQLATKALDEVRREHWNELRVR